MDVIVIPNVHPKYANLPTKGIYRFRGFSGKLSDLPDGCKFALMVNTPTAWNVDGGSDDADVDNLQVGMDPVVLEMRGLVVEAEVQGAGRGLQGVPIELHDKEDDEIISKGVSMAYPGYVQLRAPPGVYYFAVPSNEYLKMTKPIGISLDSLAYNTARIPVEPVLGDESILSRHELPSQYPVISRLMIV